MLKEWIQVHGVEDKDAMVERQEGPAERRQRLKRAKPDGRLDLHGLNREEAQFALSSFFKRAQEEAWEKVFIIHGKGNRSEDGPVLRREVQLFIESCPWAGESGYADKQNGGTGTTWVLLKPSSTATN